MSEQDAASAADALINKKISIEYWEGVDADANGMLGGIPAVPGFSSVLRVDLQGSRTFLARLGIGVKNGRRKLPSALEGGAGIGRVTEGLLVKIADEVDIIEPVAKFTAALRGKPGIRSIFGVGLEEWQPTKGLQYELIWVQWCVGHLTDQQLVKFLERCKDALNSDDGIIVIKENLSTGGADFFDERDSSVTREDIKFQDIFLKAGLHIIRAEIQRGFPTSSFRNLLPVKMYALKPKPNHLASNGMESGADVLST